MQILRKLSDRLAPQFEEGGRFEKLHPLYEGVDSFLFSVGNVTRSAAHVRDGLDLKRMMMTVVVALVGCVFMAMYNTGYQAAWAVSQGAGLLPGWQATVFEWLGLELSTESLFACIVFGALHYVPVLVVVFAAGGAVEVLFSVLRKHEINEGFLVTGMLLPLILPPTIPLWQAGLGTAFGVPLRQGGLRRDGHELPEPRPRGPRVPVLRLPRAAQRRGALDRGRLPGRGRLHGRDPPGTVGGGGGSARRGELEPRLPGPRARLPWARRRCSPACWARRSLS